MSNKYPFINGRDCKILVPPEFVKLPTTDSANVNENIDNWISRDKQSMLSSFCRTPEQDKNKPEDKKKYYRYHNGYRFVEDSDFEQSLETIQEVKGISVKCLCVRRVHSTDSFCPLWFMQWYLSLYFTIGDSERVIDWKSDNQLKIELKKYKDGVG